MGLLSGSMRISHPFVMTLNSVDLVTMKLLSILDTSISSVKTQYQCSVCVVMILTQVGQKWALDLLAMSLTASTVSIVNRRVGCAKTSRSVSTVTVSQLRVQVPQLPPLSPHQPQCLQQSSLQQPHVHQTMSGMTVPTTVHRCATTCTE
jgi:hypothetical protein